VSAPEAALRAELDRLAATAQAAERQPSLSACVFRDGVPVWTHAVGIADVDTAADASPDSQYRIGSITKTFTAVLVMQLRDAGALSLDDPLTKHIPESPHAPTIRRLLSHTSGIQREPPGEIWESMQPPTREELVAQLGDAEQVLAPGFTWHYSNLAFALLGEVVARHHGRDWFEVLEERVLRPLRLVDTVLAPTRAARGYFVEPFSDAVRLEPDVEANGTAAIGHLWSTARDLAAWGAFIARPDETVLAPATVDEMALVETMVDQERWSLGWGLGLELYRSGERVFAGHGGAMPGFLAGLVVARKERIGAAVLTNSGAGPKPEALALALASAVADAWPVSPEPWQPGETAPPEVAELLGPWWTEGHELVLRWRDGRLEAVLTAGVPGRNVSTFEQEGDGIYRCVEGRERGELLRVVRDVAGAVEKLYFATYPARREPSTF